MKQLVLKIIRFYRKRISPLFPPTCRFYPTCSTYAVIAIERHGLLKGSFLAIRRLSKCNILFPGGFDPVPELKEKYRQENKK